ncbi:DMT family transporter [Paracoccus siganidrum]|uniref:DMT family transporter n=1 Tax=Paracoccus siganidrum TaxID=1276757 RepID=A0A419A4K9_9RHOB|nr:DMT family transporter [Paracoccus siganidrum]RJL09449.1 DMT family transporter [Paracoccus siganidrum]RMC39052.1 EamA/RhaT family transporter [Paracoccus siganidrum]
MRTPIISPIRRMRPASITPAPLQPGDNLRGAMLMCLSMLGFTCNDTVMKFVTQEMPLYQAITLRGVVVILGIGLIAWREGGLKLRIAPGARLPMALRVIGEIGSTLLFLNALMHMAIGDLSAIMQALPLVVMLAAALFFGEKLGWRRMSAVIVGLLGVLIILRPGSGTFGIWALVALGSMLLVALRDLATRRFGREVRSSTIAFYAAIAVALTGLVMSLGQGWVAPSLSQLLLLGLAGAFLTVGYVSAVSAMRVGEMSYVAPFRYTSLLAAIFLGLVVFGEWPDLWTWLGSALVVGAGGYTIWREAQLGWRR